MDYTLLVGDEKIPVRVDVRESGLSMEFRQGEARDISTSLINGNRVTFTMDGRNVTAYLAPDQGDREVTIVMVRGRRYRIMDAGLAELKAARKKAAGPDLPDSVTPPMPSVVVRVLVGENDHVTKGQGVIVVSAMKTETTLAAPFSGLVTGIHAAEGDSVRPGQVLVDIEPGPENEE